jgi:uncharacterized membrane protein
VFDTNFAMGINSFFEALIDSAMFFIVVSIGSLIGSYLVKVRWSKWIYLCMVAFGVLALIWNTAYGTRIFIHRSTPELKVLTIIFHLIERAYCVLINIPVAILTVLSFRRASKNHIGIPDCGDKIA